MRGEGKAREWLVVPHAYVKQGKVEYLKGQCHEIFCFLFFSWFIFHQAPENNITIPSQNAPPLSTTPVANFATSIAGVVDTGGNRDQWHRQQICHWCRWYWWQIMRTISDCWHLKVNFKEKCLLFYPKVSKKIIKLFWGKIFSISRDTCGAPWAANSFVNFWKNLKQL